MINTILLTSTSNQVHYASEKLGGLSHMPGPWAVADPMPIVRRNGFGLEWPNMPRVQRQRMDSSFTMFYMSWQRRMVAISVIITAENDKTNGNRKPSSVLVPS
jgi:hypothetical protein